MTQTAFDRLRAEHRVVLEHLREFEAALEAVSEMPTPETRAAMSRLLDFVRTEVWRHFHAEETALFPLLGNLFPPENAPIVGGPVFVLTEEHGVLRRLVARLEQDVERWEASQAGAAEAVQLTGRQTIRAFQKHIYKEDNIVFRLAESTLTGDERAQLEEAFEKVLAEG